MKNVSRTNEQRQAEFNEGKIEGARQAAVDRKAGEKMELQDHPTDGNDDYGWGWTQGYNQNILSRAGFGPEKDSSPKIGEQVLYRSHGNKRGHFFEEGQVIAIIDGSYSLSLNDGSTIKVGSTDVKSLDL